MDRQTRIALLVDHFRNPRHRGTLEHPDVSMPGGNPGCGDVVTMHVRAADGDDRIAEVSFEGEGCTISQAAASILAQRANRKHYTFDEIAAMSYEEMIDLLGSDIVGSRPRCATLALGTLKAAVKRIEMDRRLRAAGRSDEEIAQMRAAIAQQAGGGLVFGEDAVAEARADQTAAPPDRDVL
ncbi:MAG TPA: iron-sulfur cluster assembly scaffold protein [Longimicrobiales bacterium]|nr:iron-sulfur cluster assembly scaffold protein [Longimicrobiales bacterium]